MIRQKLDPEFYSDFHADEEFVNDEEDDAEQQPCENNG